MREMRAAHFAQRPEAWRRRLGQGRSPRGGGEAKAERRVISDARRGGTKVPRLFKVLGLATAGLALASCVTSAQPGSKEEAVNTAWERYCNSGYCEGFPGRIVGRTESTLTVNINGHIRYMTYTVSGGPGSYVAEVRPTADRGRVPP